jgi:hypothetical protein
MSTSALMGRSPMARRRRCIHSGDGPFLTPRTRRRAKAGQSFASSGGKSSFHRHRARALSCNGGNGLGLERAETGRRQIAGDAVDRGAVGPVRGEVDLDHRIVEAGVRRVGLADRRIRGQIDDALVVVRDLELRGGAEHAAAFDAADGADAQRDLLARM